IDKANKGLNKNENVNNYDPKDIMEIMESLKPRTFTGAPNITIKHSDILLAFKGEFKRVYPTGKDDRWQQYAETNFGQIPTTNVL
ncbi:18311_t:CDS:2, partial [Gigaspora rosea]